MDAFTNFLNDYGSELSWIIGAILTLSFLTGFGYLWKEIKGIYFSWTKQWWKL